jgi:hypothetical protein
VCVARCGIFSFLDAQGHVRSAVTPVLQSDVDDMAGGRSRSEMSTQEQEGQSRRSSGPTQTPLFVLPPSCRSLPRRLQNKLPDWKLSPRDKLQYNEFAWLCIRQTERRRLSSQWYALSSQLSRGIMFAYKLLAYDVFQSLLVVVWEP